MSSIPMTVADVIRYGELSTIFGVLVGLTLAMFFTAFASPFDETNEST